MMFTSLHNMAQVDSLRLKLDSVFMNIDKSQIPTGFLNEYGAQFANLKTFNGVLTDSNTVNAVAWDYIYASVYSAKIYGTNTLSTPQNNYTVCNSEALLNFGVNPVSMLALNYSSLKPDALTNNLFTISNNQLFDVQGRTQSPYQLNTAFAAAPFYERDNDGVLKLIFKQNLFINNTGKQVSSIQVNFANGGGFVTVNWNTLISTTYTSVGVKQLTFKLSFTDGASLQCYSNVTITNVSGILSTYQPSTTTIAFNPPINNTHSGGDVTVQYSINNTTPPTLKKFQKPLIVVEGFDMHDAAPLLMPDGYSYIDFLQELNSQATRFNALTFNDNLDNVAGYDLVFLNFRDGTDDIIRNALLLEEVINWVNNNKATGAQQNVIIGISMGGLVSRYCLAKMTKANQSPQTRLLITHDSPHRGANIPLGMQYLINDFANKRVLGVKLQDWLRGLKQAVNLQLRPATMQQLIVRNDPTTGILGYNTFLALNGPYRQMVTFAPPPAVQPAYKFVATSQGSQCGIQVMAPSINLANTSGQAGVSFILGAFGSKFTGEVLVNALPNGTPSQRITFVDIKSKSTIFWISFTSTLLRFEHYSPSGILGYDGCPAGTQPMSRGTNLGNIAPDANSGGFIPPIVFKYFYTFSGLTLQPEFSFLPTVSALDEDNITATSLYAAHVGSLYTPANSRVLQEYIAQEKATSIYTGGQVYNIQHTDFTARNANWMFNEMQNVNPNNLNCTNECASSTYSITGSGLLCTSSGYSLNPITNGETVTWSSTPANSVSFNPVVGFQTTASKVGSGNVTINATVSSCPSSNPFTTSIPVHLGGYSSSDYPVSGPSSTCKNTYVTYTTNTLPAATSYTWFYPAGGTWTYISGQNTPSITLRTGTTTGNFQVGVRVANACDAGGSYAIANTFVSNCGSFAVEASPNPTNGELVVDATSIDASSKIANNKIYKINVVDQSGNTVKTFSFPGLQKAKVSLAGLNQGIYQLAVFNGTEWSSKLIVVN